MSPVVAPAAAVLAGLVLFFVPGLLFFAALPREEQERTPLDEAFFLVVGLSVAVSAWAALLLGELKLFSLPRVATFVLTLSLLVAAATFLARRRLPRRLVAGGGPAALVPGLLVLALAVGLQARPSEHLVGGRDPGAYVAAMGLIARSGGIEYVDPLVLAVPPEDAEIFFRHPDKPVAFSWARFMGFDLERPQSGRVYPEFFHLFPAFGACLFAAMGAKGALATPVVFGVLGTLGVFVAFRRLLGPAPALLGVLLLATNVVHVWFARYPVSETVSLFLFTLALLAFARFEESDRPVFAALAGALLGLGLLVRIDAVLVVLPLGLYIGHRLARRDISRQALLALVLPFALLAGHAGAHAVLFARKYLLQVLTRRYWSFPPVVWAGLALLAVLLLVLSWKLGPRLSALVERHDLSLRRLGIALLALVSAYAYFLRPQLSAWAGADGNEAARALADPGLLRAAGFDRLAAHDAGAFFRLGWFVTPVGLFLGVAGFALVLHDGRRKLLFPSLLFASFAGFYFYKIRIWNDYFFALRRFVPVVLPFLLVFAAYALVRLAARNARSRLLAGGLALFLLGAFGVETWRLGRFVDWKDSVEFVRTLARKFSKDDVVLFEQPKSIHLLSLPLWALHGTNALEFARFDPDPERLRHLLEAWRGRFRNVYFVHTPRTDLCGVFMERVQAFAFGTYEWERTYDRAPRAPKFQSLHFSLSRFVSPSELNVPPLPEVDVGGSDDVVVSGFFGKEILDNARTYRWSGTCGAIYFPGLAPGVLAVTASGGPRPALAEVQVSLSGLALGSFLAGPGFDTFRLPLPEELPAGPLLLRFDVAPWRPGERDGRELGIMLDRVAVEPRARVNLSRSASSGGGP
ncbi:MAG TPA: glycosyltransferase family 39 protein [Vicinamibacteria bacterium]